MLAVEMVEMVEMDEMVEMFRLTQGPTYVGPINHQPSEAINQFNC